MDFSKHVSIPDSIFAQEVDGEMVLLDMNSENYYGLDAVATDIWRLLREGKSLEETVAELLEIYDVDEARLRQDLEDFVSRLTEQGLAEPE
jgi:ornithine carbamoyltransferase